MSRTLQIRPMSVFRKSDDLRVSELPLSIRLEIADGRTTAIFDAGAALPAVWEERFTVGHPSQTSIPLQLLVGEGNTVDENQRIGELLIRTISPPGQFQPIVDVRLTVDEDGSITAKASAAGVNLPVKSRLKKPASYLAPDAVRRIRSLANDEREPRKGS